MSKGKFFFYWLTGLMLTAALSIHLGALDPRKKVSQYIHKKWSTSDGLPDNIILAILQTSDSYLWIGTNAGLVRFDGIKFEIFNTDNTECMPDNRIKALLETGDKRLWVGTRGGLMVYKDGKFLSRTGKNGLLHDVVNALCEDSEGNVWVGYRKKGLTVFERGDLSALHHPPELSNVNIVNHMFTDNRGITRIATVDGLFRLRERKSEEVPLKEKLGIPRVRVFWLTPGEEGSIWMGTDKSGLLEYKEKGGTKDGTVKSYNMQSGLKSNWVNTVFFDRDGVLWAGTESGGLHRLHGGVFSVFSEKDGLSNDSVTCLHEDREGNLWVGTYSGLNLLKDGMFVTYTEKEGLLDNVTWTVYEDRQKNLWLTTNDGLSRYRDGRFISYRKKDGLISNFVSSTWEDKKGNLWVGTYDKGLDRLTGGVFTHIGPGQGMTAISIRAIYEDTKENLWVGTYGKGLFKMPAGEDTFVCYSTKNGFPTDHVFIIYEDGGGGLWIGTDGSGVIRLKDGKTSVYTMEDGLSSNVIYAILEDRERPGTMWLGSEGNGLNYFAGGKIVPVTKKNGLKDSCIYNIIEDDNGFFWMSGTKGITWVRKQEFYDFVDGKIDKVRATIFGKADGMKGDDCNGGFQPAGCRSGVDGRIWFPTPHGAVAVDPNKKKINPLPPPLRVEHIFLDGTRVAPVSPVIIEPGINKVEIYYTALSFSEPHKVRFKYILEGFEEEWTATGKRRDRFATYTNIPPGRYTFRVTACNNDGIWNEEGVLVTLSVGYPFYRTWWFIFIAVVLFAILSYFAISSLRHLFKMIDFWRKKNYIGKYRVIEQIGSGGMANIFKVVSGKGTQRRFYALKLMKEEYMFDAVYRKRFLDEGAIVDRLEHSNIVKVVERGEHDRNLFIAMELLEGLTLECLLERKGRLTPGESVPIILQVLGALSRIHGAGIIHRDMKPGNIMLVKRGDTEYFVKVLDFGLARTQSITRVTESGMVVGTLNYLSPEQLMNSRYSSASDIYALGIIFYEMLTGERPYGGETPLEVIQAIFKTEVRGPKVVNPDIPEGLNKVVLSMIDKTPESRPSAEALETMLVKMPSSPRHHLKF